MILFMIETIKIKVDMKNIKNIKLILIILCFSEVAMSQSVISVVHTDGNSAFFGDLQAAVGAAQSGDFVYVPGGAFSMGNDTIKKGVAIIGAGHYPDSTLATNQTIITGTIRIGNGADGLHLEGLFISGNVELTHAGNNYQRADNVMIRRCSVANITCNGSVFTQNEPDTSFSQNWQVVQNVIRGDVNFGYMKAFTMHANIVNGHIYNAFWGGTFTNNNFLYISQSDRVFAGVRFSTVKDNIFYTNWDISYPGYACDAPACGSYGNTFLNNMFATAPSGLNAGVVVAEVNNIFSVSADYFFQNYSPGGFNYNNNFQLIEGSPGIGAASDGTDIGIYGSNDNYKDSAVPFNPHIGFKNIGSNTTPNGMLQVHIRVSAQDR